MANDTFSQSIGKTFSDTYLGVSRWLAGPKFLEFCLWLIAGFLVSGRAWNFLASGERCSDLILGGCISSISALLGYYYWDFLAATTVVLFPIVFNLIFGAFPLEKARQNIGSKQVYDPETASSEMESVVRSSDPSAIRIRSVSTAAVQFVPRSAAEMAADHALSSGRLASNIYSRSGVYLLLGVLVAFSGLAFFYLRNAPIGKEGDLATHLLALAPNFGILFFIEFIAFFFLRQYRAALDEFRYYEALKRRREEMLLILQLVKESETAVDIFKTLRDFEFHSTIGKLSQGETTEILESKKLQKDEIELVDRFLELIAKIKA